MVDDFVPQLEVVLGGTELTAELYDRLVFVRAESSIQLPDVVTLTFIDEDFALYDRNICSIGDTLAVSITSSGEPRTVAECEITAIAVQPDDEGGMTLVLTAHGADHVLHRGVGLETFVDQTDSEIVSTVARSLGLRVQAEPSPVRHPYVMQATTASRFIAERAACVGFRWWVDGRTLHFAKEGPAVDGPTLRWGADLLSLRVLSSSIDATPQVEVRSWNPDNQQSISATADQASSLEMIGTTASGPVADADASRGMTTLGRFEASRPTDDLSAARAMATGIAHRAAATAVKLDGCALGDSRLRAGSTVTIENVGSRLSGTYALATVEHIYSASDGYVTRFVTGGQDADGLVDLLRSPAPTAPWNAGALVIGVVTNVSDPERPARVKVRFPTFSDEHESAWARLVLPGAGDERGFLLIPEIDDEVLVGFEHGDASRPVVLGGLWSKRNKPPLPTTTAVEGDAVRARTWRSRAGHSITINDDSSKDPDAVIIELADGKTRLTLAQDKVLIETPSDLTLKTDRNATIKAAGDLKLEGVNVEIKATSKLALEGATATLKGSASLALDAAKVDVKASTVLALDGGPMAQLKGGMVQFN